MTTREASSTADSAAHLPLRVTGTRPRGCAATFAACAPDARRNRRTTAARHFGVSRESVRKMLAFSVPPGYRRTAPVRRPKLDGFTGLIAEHHSNRIDELLPWNTRPDTVLSDAA